MWTLVNLQENLLIGSTLVEGSTLSEAQAREVLAGRTVVGHPISEARELLNYRAAVEWLIERVEDVPYLSTDLVQDFHRILFRGFPGVHGQWKAHANFTLRTDGKRHDFLRPAKVPDAMRDWVHRFNADEAVSPPATAAELYYSLVQIHPFDDGNGRIARVLIAYWLHWKASLSFRFHVVDKLPHLEALEAANDRDFNPLQLFFAERTTPEAP